MKSINKIYTLLSLVSATFAYAQTGIETTTPRGSSLVDFPQNENRGIILPKATAPIGTVGSLVMDVTQGKVMINNGTQWMGLNTNAATGLPALDNSKVSETIKSTIVGATTSTANGVLILESTSKALVLPWVANPHLNMIRPEPGTICYDTVSKSIAVYNGLEWSYWK